MNNPLIDMSALLAFILFLSGFGQQVTEYLFGALLTGTPIRFVAIGVTVGLAFAFRLIGGAFFPVPLTIAQTAVVGALSGLGSNLVHVLLEHFGVKTDTGSLSGLLVKMLNGKTR